MRTVRVAVAFAAILLAGAGTASAWHAEGKVLCDDGNGLVSAGDLPLEGVLVTVNGTSSQGPFSASTVTDSNGHYYIYLPDEDGSFTLTLTLPAGGSFVLPATGTYLFDTDPVNHSLDNANFLLLTPACQTAKCWLTGGGAKFNQVLNDDVAQHGPQHSFGGNVYPGCNPDSGEGGQWNHLAHVLKLHFQGWAIQVVRCGNVSGIPPGSTSPVTPYNFIEFQGTGTLKGIQGNKVNYGTVTFFARAEDRNEPGSHGAKDGAKVDRYFLRVLDGGGTARLLIDLDGNPATVDPVTITDGNLQIHISSCSNPPSF